MKMQMLQIQEQELNIKELKAQERILKILDKLPVASQIEILESILGKYSLESIDNESCLSHDF